MRQVRAEPASVVDAMLDVRHPVKMAMAEWAQGLDPGDLVARDLSCSFWREAWSACAEEGLLGSLVPRQHGGGDVDLVTATLRLEGFGLGCRDNGLAFALISQMLTFQEALTRFGDDTQRRTLLEPACRGELIGAFAITEPGSGSDAYAMTTRAERTDRGWRITGEKAHITLAPVADAAIVFARTDPDAGRWGISAFIVRAGRPGVEFGESRPKMGLRTVPYGSIRLEGYEADDADLLGVAGAGASIFASCIEGERGLIMATHLGAAERSIHAAIARANGREQFGRTIGTYQAVSHRVADMVMRHEAARLLIYKAAAAIERGRGAPLAAAQAKLAASEAVVAIATDAARIHGADGYATEHEVEREVRDAMGALAYGGTPDIQRNLIAALVGVAGGGH